jgi:hypothetical protein
LHAGRPAEIVSQQHVLHGRNNIIVCATKTPLSGMNAGISLSYEARKTR